MQTNLTCLVIGIETNQTAGKCRHFPFTYNILDHAEHVRINVETDQTVGKRKKGFRYFHTHTTQLDYAEPFLVIRVKTIQTVGKCRQR